MNLTNKIILPSRIKDTRLKNRIDNQIRKKFHDSMGVFLTSELSNDYRTNLRYLKKMLEKYQESLNKLLDQGYEILKEDIDYSFSLEDMNIDQKCVFVYSWVLDYAIYENKVLAKRCPLGSDKKVQSDN